MTKKSDDKKSDDKDKNKDKRDLEEEDEDESTEDEDEEDEDEDEDEEEEEAAAPAKPATRPGRRPPSSTPVREPPAPQEDPYWWTPYAVLCALVLIGVLGFLGIFNKTPLARLAAPVAPAHEEPHHTATPTPPSPATQALPRPNPAAQPPREMFGAKHLLVMYKGSLRAPPTVTRTQDEAKARAAEAAKKAKAEPAKFADFVKEYTDEPGGAARGGDLGKFPKGSMVPEFQAGLEKIKVNEISDVVETKFGYHVILRTQ